jgi:hypothetical protein
MNLTLMLAELGKRYWCSKAWTWRAPWLGACSSMLVRTEGALRQALTLAEECGMRPHLARHLRLGKLYRRTGRRDPSRAALVDVVKLFREMDTIFWLPEAEAELAQVSDQSLTWAPPRVFWASYR